MRRTGVKNCKLRSLWGVFPGLSLSLNPCCLTYQADWISCVLHNYKSHCNRPSSCRDAINGGVASFDARWRFDPPRHVPYIWVVECLLWCLRSSHKHQDVILTGQIQVSKPKPTGKLQMCFLTSRSNSCLIETCQLSTFMVCWLHLSLVWFLSIILTFNAALEIHIQRFKIKIWFWQYWPWSLIQCQHASSRSVSCWPLL